MEIRVRLFAGLAAAAGKRELTWKGQPSVTPRDVWRDLVEDYPAFADHTPQVKVAVNEEYADWEQELKPGDEVAFLTPVSGGMAADGGAGEAVQGGGAGSQGAGSQGDGADESAAGSSGQDGEGQQGSSEGQVCWVTDKPLMVDDVMRLVNRPEAGAIVLFAGISRRYTGDRVTEHLEYDAYPSMAVSEMNKIVKEVEEKWPGTRVAMVHRTGVVDIGEASVLIAVSAPHRTEAFPAARYAIDRLKETVPIWKKEVWAGGEMWVGDATSQPPYGAG